MEQIGFSGGDWIALGALGLGVLGFVIRERRAEIGRATVRAATEANFASLCSELKTELATSAAEIGSLEEKRQKHDMECARIQERVAASLDRVADRLDRHDQAIASLQAQMSHVASGAANTVRELPPIRRK